jgi:asparagine synthase (glutamine-hydrolysing)
MVIGAGTEPQTAHASTDAWPDAGDFESQLMAFDMMTLLPDAFLTKTDRATMGAGLEARAPILDHRIVEFALRLPKEFKLSAEGGKRVLRELLYRHVPRPLVDRRKMGFGVPMPVWLRGPLRPWAEELLDARSLRADGIFDERQVRGRWNDLMRGSDWWAGPLWVVLTFQSWMQAWQRPEPRTFSPAGPSAK